MHPAADTVQVITRPETVAPDEALPDAGPDTGLDTGLDDPPLDHWPVVGRQPGRLTLAWWWLLDVPADLRTWVRGGGPGVVLLGAAGVLAALALLGTLLVLAGPADPPVAAIRPAASPHVDTVPAAATERRARAVPAPSPARITATATGGERRLVVRVRSSEWVALELWLYGPAGRVVERRGMQVGPEGWSLRLTDLAAGDYRWRLVRADGRPVRGVVTVRAAEPTSIPSPETTPPPSDGTGDNSGNDSTADDTDETVDETDQTDPPEPVDPGDVPEPVDPDA